jgi:hypothetical protein
MPKTGSAVAKSKKAGELASSGKSRKAAEDAKGDPFAHHESVTPEEFSAYTQYQGYFYHDINAHLRQTPNAHLAAPAAVASIPHLNSLIGKQSLKRDVTVYRGMLAHAGFDPSAYRAGDVYEARGFFSTSLKKSTAAGFTDPLNAPEGSVLFHINAPKGTKALPGYKLGTGSSFQKSEREVLFAHGSRVKISKITRAKSGIYHFHGTFE